MKSVCPECRTENEPERIYCHECGARLERPPAEKRDPRKVAKASRHSFRALDPGRVQMRLTFFKVSKLILGAFGAAILIQMILPPDVPPAVKSLILPPQIGLELDNAVMDRRTTPITYTEANVNAYLAGVSKNKHAALQEWIFDFDRVLVGFEEGRCSIIAERSLFGFPIYTTTVYGVEPRDGKLEVSNYGGRIGRLSVHPQIMRFDDLLFGDLWMALNRESKTLAKMGSIEFHSHSVVLTAAP